MFERPNQISRGFAGLIVGMLGLEVAAFAAVRPFAADRPASSLIAYDSVQRRYALQATGAWNVTYTVDLDDFDLGLGMLRIEAAVNGGTPTPILTRAGTRWRDAAGVVFDPTDYAPFASAALTSHGIEDSAVVLRFREHPGVRLLDKTYRLSLSGLSLVVEFGSEETAGTDGYAGVSLGSTGNAPGAKVVTLPFLNEGIVLFADGSVLTAYLDPTVSSSASMRSLAGPGSAGSLFAHSRSTADPDTAGISVPLDETAYVTLAEALTEVYPRAIGSPSPYRSAISPLLVLDVWTMHFDFGVPEGVTLGWASPEVGATSLALRYRDANPNCGDGVRITVLHGDSELTRIDVANGATTEQVWTSEVILALDDVIRVQLDRNGSNNCDSTRLRLTVDTPGDLFDSEVEFSGIQGHRGWQYLELVGSNEMPMTYDTGAQIWEGVGSYSQLWRGYGHPGQGPTAYLGAEQMVRRYREYGLTQLAVLFHDWQRWGYDAGLPDHHPANPDRGSSAELAAFTAAARTSGMLVGLHENYTDMYPDNPPDHPSPLADPTAIALTAGGSEIVAWYNPQTGQQSKRIASGRMNDFAAAEGPSIARDYAPSASFLDVTPGWTPAWTIDHDAADGAVPTLARAFTDALNLFATIKATYNGPLFGEGGEGPDRFDTWFAGPIDGVERQVEGRSRSAVAPDFELLAVKPRMLNHGMGYYSRYFADFGQLTSDLADVDLDQYRATEIAFGHAGFLGDHLSAVPNWLRVHGPEYWLMQALQTRYAEAPIDHVTYDAGGVSLDLESALRAGVALDRARITNSFTGGLTVHVNRDAAEPGAGVLGDFSSQQGGRGWQYLEDRGGGTLYPATWDPVGRRWVGSRPFLLLTESGGHPDQYAAVRTWTSPVTALVRIQGKLEDIHLTCGDGVIGRILSGAVQLWSCTLTGTDPAPCGAFDLTTFVGPGTVLSFRIEPKANSNCDSTAFPATLSWLDGASHDWTVTTPDGPRVLPPSGFFAYGPGEFRAYTATIEGDLADYVRAPEYGFARARSGVVQQIEEFETDGAIAVRPGTHGDDLHGLDLSTARRDGAPLLDCAPRADVNLRFLDERRALLTVRDAAAGAAAASVTWGGIPQSWHQVLLAHPGDLEIRPADEQGNPTGPPGPSGGTAAAPFFADLAIGRSYLVRLGSECLAAVGCGSNESCCAGRCVAEPSWTAFDRDGADVVGSWNGACPFGYTVLRSTTPADFGAAQSTPVEGTEHRDVGAAATAESYYYRVR